MLPETNKLIRGIYGYLLSQINSLEYYSVSMPIDGALFIKENIFAGIVDIAFNNIDSLFIISKSTLFERASFRNEILAVLVPFLGPTGHLDITGLAIRMTNLPMLLQASQYTYSAREMEKIGAVFLNSLAHQIKNEPALEEFRDNNIIDYLIEDTENILSDLSQDKATPSTRYDYLFWVVHRYLYLDWNGVMLTHRQIQLKLEEVYTPLSLILDYPKSISKDNKTYAYHIGDDNTQRGVFDISTLLSQHPYLVILGDPGSGKTALLRYLALKHAQAGLRGGQNAGSHLGATRFPILAQLGDYPEMSDWRTLTLSDYLVNYIVHHEFPSRGLPDLVKTELEGNGALVLLDGLDEVVNYEDRILITEKIKEFTLQYPNVYCIVTSRIAGYRSLNIDGYILSILQEMNEQQIRVYLEVLCSALEAAAHPDISAELRIIRVQREVEDISSALISNIGVRHLASNPLLLRLLVLLYRTGANLPRKRIELYDLASSTLSRTWRISQGVAEEALALLNDSILIPLLSSVAYWIHTNRPTGIATEDEIYQVLGNAWARLSGLKWDYEEANPLIIEQLRSFLRVVREHTGIFGERSPSRYGFISPIFEEYYAARYLISRSKTQAELVRSRLEDPRWEEPILLALGFLGLNSPEDAAELFEDAILNQHKYHDLTKSALSSYDYLSRSNYLFALRCLADDVPVHRNTMHLLLQRLSNELLYQIESDPDMSYRESLRQRVASLSGSEAAYELVGMLKVALDEKDPKLRQVAVLSIGWIGDSSLVMGILHTALEDVNWEVRRAAAESMGRFSGTREVITALQTTLQDPVPAVRSVAANSLANLGATPLVLSALQIALKDIDPGVRRAVVRSLGSLERTAEVVSILQSALIDPDSGVRRIVVRSLGNLGEAEETLAALVISLEDRDPNVRVAALESLGTFGGTPKVLEVLIDALGDIDQEVRETAAVILGRLGHGLAIIEAESLIKNPPVVIELPLTRALWVNEATELTLRVSNNSDSTLSKIMISIKESAEYTIIGSNGFLISSLTRYGYQDIKFTISAKVAKQIAISVQINKGDMQAVYIIAIKDNPYVAGDPVRDEPAFFGRSEELEEIIQAVTKPAKQDILIIGERRMGKTSLIYQVQNRLGPPYIPVYVALNQAGITTIDFLETIRHKVIHALVEASLLDKNWEDHHFSYLDLSENLSDVIKEARLVMPDLRIVLLLDEADSLLNVKVPGHELDPSAPLDEQLQNRIRGALQSREIGANVRAVVAGTHDLWTYVSGHSSPFFNHFRPVLLEPLSIEDTQLLILTPAAMLGYAFSKQAVDIINNLSGGQPYYCQAICFHAFASAQKAARKQIDIQDVEYAEQEVLKELLSPYSAGYWQRMNRFEQKFISALANKTSLPAHNRSDIKRLINWQVIKFTGGRYEFVVQLFADLTRMIIAQEQN